MRSLLLGLLLGFGWVTAGAQELYIATDPASNMPANSLSFRLSSRVMPASDGLVYRTMPSVGIGISKTWMIHLSTSFTQAANTTDWTNDGWQFYSKFRLLSIDKSKNHFRVASYFRLSESRRKLRYSDISSGGDHTSFTLGAIATQLIHKTALSANLSYNRGWNQNTWNDGISQGNSWQYVLSAGYLLYPQHYKSYSATNWNLYLEVPGGMNQGFEEGNTIQNGYWIDIQPGIQWIFNSKSRIDLAWRTQAAGNVNRMSFNQILLRLEYNLFSIW